MPGVQDPTVIDVVTRKPEGGFELVMVETRPWRDVAQVKDVRAKVDNYVAFLTSGQMERTYPESAGAVVSIRLDCVEEPTAEIREALQAIAVDLDRHGLQFVVALLPPDTIE